MADSSHVIKSTLEFDDGDIAKRLKLIEQQFKRMAKTIARMDRRGNGMNDRFKKLDNNLGKLSRTVQGLFRGFTRLFTMFAKFSFLAMAGEIALFSAALLGVKLALITGRAAASLYNITLKGLSVTAASVASALATAAAAMRQFQEAQLSPFLGGGVTGMGQVARMGRGLGATTSGLLGGQGSQQLIGSLARAGFSGGTGIRLGQQVSALFNYDPKAAAQFVGTLGQARTTGSLGPAIQALTAAPGFAKNTNISATNLSGLVSLINSGNIINPAFAGQGDLLGRTFIGTAKTSFVGLRDQFADVGDDLLEPMRQSFLQIANILRENFLGLQVIIQRFGADSMGPTMVTIFDRMMRFITENVIDHLGNIKEMGENFVGFFRSVRNFFVGMGDFLGRYEPAANVIIDMFKAASNANKSSLFRDFSRNLVSNRDSIMQFGSSMGKFMGGVFNLFEAGNNAFFGGGIDRIGSIVNAIVDEVFPAMKDFFGAASPLMERLPTILEMIADGLRMLTPVMSGLFQVVGQLVDAMKFLGAGGLLGIGALGMTGRGRRGMSRMAGGRGGMMAIGRGIMPVMMGMAGANAIYGSLGDTFYGRNTQYGLPNFNTQSTFALGGAGIGAMIAGLLGTGNIPAALLMGAIAGTTAAFGINFAGDLAKHFGAADPEKNLSKIYGTMFHPGMIAVNDDYSAADFRRDNLAFHTLFNTDLDLMRLMADPSIEFQEAANPLQRRLGITTSRKQFQFLQEASGLFNDAIMANAKTGKKGDSEEFKRFLTSIGINADTANRNDLFDILTGQGDLGFDFAGKSEAAIEALLRRERQNQTAGVSQANLALGSFTSTVMMSRDAISSFASKLGLDMMNLSREQSKAVGTMAAASAMLFDRNLGLIPDIGNSGVGRAEKRASASAALNAIIAGDVSTAAITDFLSKFAVHEVSLGNSPDLAGLAALIHLQRRIRLGSFGANTAKVQDVVNVGTDNFFAELSARTFIEQDVLQRIFDNNGGMVTGDNAFSPSGLGALDRHIGKQLELRQAISGTAGMGFFQRLKILQSTGFNFQGSSRARRIFVEALMEDTGMELNKFIGMSEGQFATNMQAHVNQGNIDQNELAKALSQAFVGVDMQENQLELINQGVRALPEEIAKAMDNLIEIYINDGSDGGDVSLGVTTAVQNGFLNITDALRSIN